MQDCGPQLSNRGSGSTDHNLRGCRFVCSPRRGSTSIVTLAPHRQSNWAIARINLLSNWIPNMRLTAIGVTGALLSVSLCPAAWGSDASQDASLAASVTAAASADADPRWAASGPHECNGEFWQRYPAGELWTTFCYEKSIGGGCKFAGRLGAPRCGGHGWCGDGCAAKGCGPGGKCGGSLLDSLCDTFADLMRGKRSGSCDGHCSASPSSGSAVTPPSQPAAVGAPAPPALLPAAEPNLPRNEIPQRTTHRPAFQFANQATSMRLSTYVETD